jgi:protein-S-isoprenylcysteine O-methyltransferase Ste14
MAPIATTHAAARILLEVTAISFAVSEVYIRLRSASRREGEHLDRGSLAAVVAGIGTGLLIAVRCSTELTGAMIPGGWAPYLIGLVLMWLGIGLRQWAFWTLGRFFTVVIRVTDEQTVVEHGPYHWVRHPSYTGLLMTLVGLGAALGNWLSVLALAVLPTLGLLLRIRVEEQASWPRWVSPTVCTPSTTAASSPGSGDSRSERDVLLRPRARAAWRWRRCTRR